MVEEWKPIGGYEGRYEVSSIGNIRNVVTGRMLKPRTNGFGYHKVNLTGESGYKTHKVHRLVASAFIGEPNGLEVNHIDGCKTNNAASNLEYMTRSENIRHSYMIGATGKQRNAAKVTEAIAQEIRSLRSTMTQQAIARKYGIGALAVWKIMQRDAEGNSQAIMATS